MLLALRRIYAHLAQTLLDDVYFRTNGPEWMAAQLLNQRSGSDSGSHKKGEMKVKSDSAEDVF